MVKVGSYRGEKIKYPDGEGASIWIPMDEEKQDVGVCFDFPAEDIDDLIALLSKLKKIKAKKFK